MVVPEKLPEISKFTCLQCDNRRSTSDEAYGAPHGMKRCTHVVRNRARTQGTKSVCIAEERVRASEESVDQGIRPVGYVMRTHGLKGEWRVCLADRIENPLTTLWIRSKLKWLNYDVEAMRLCGSRKKSIGWNEWLLKVQGIDSIDDAKVWVGEEIAVATDLMAPLEEGEYYLEDLVGCAVKSHTDEGIREMGEVVELFATGSNDVLRVAVPGHADQLIPFIDQVISKVDLDRRVVEITPLPGLLTE